MCSWNDTCFPSKRTLSLKNKDCPSTAKDPEVQLLVCLSSSPRSALDSVFNWCDATLFCCCPHPHGRAGLSSCLTTRSVPFLTTAVIWWMTGRWTLHVCVSMCVHMLLKYSKKIKREVPRRRCRNFSYIVYKLLEKPSRCVPGLTTSLQVILKALRTELKITSPPRSQTGHQAMHTRQDLIHREKPQKTFHLTL